MTEAKAVIAPEVVVVPNCFYSKTTNYLLNFLTLEIKDKYIVAIYRRNVSNWFNMIYWQINAINLCSLAFHVMNYFFGDGVAFAIVLNVISYLTMILWAVMLRYCPLHTPKLNLCYMTVHEVMTVLLYWNCLGSMNVEDKSRFENQIMYNFIICNAVQINDLKWTIFA